MENNIFLQVEKTYQFMKDVFIELGISEEDAGICADVLIASDLRGIKSHGIGRLKMYYDRIKAGLINPKTDIEIIKDKKSVAVWDGKHSMGHVVAKKAMQTAIDKAQKYGLGSVAVRNSTHFGIAGYYPLMAIQNNMIGMAVTNARPSVAPTFSYEPIFGTNPIAFSAPSDMEFPFLFDAATSIIQRGKVEVYNRKQVDIPGEWIIDNNGDFLKNPGEIIKKLLNKNAALLPIGGLGETDGGHKGYGLAILVEILSAALQNGSYLDDLSGIKDGKNTYHQLGHFFLAINIDFYTDIDDFKKIVGNIMRKLKNSKKLSKEQEIFVAGEKEFYKGPEIKKSGIQINPGLQQNLKIIQDELKIKTKIL